MKPATPEQIGMLNKVLAYCAKDEGNAMKLCIKLGYKTTATISQWKHRQSVPKTTMFPLQQFFLSLKVK